MEVAALNFLSLLTTRNTVSLLIFMRSIPIVLLKTQSSLGIDTRNRLGFLQAFGICHWYHKSDQEHFPDPKHYALEPLFELRLEASMLKDGKSFYELYVAPVLYGRFPSVILQTCVLTFAQGEHASDLEGSGECRSQS